LRPGCSHGTVRIKVTKPTIATGKPTGMMSN
jgi:hypothetical protein